MVWRYSPEMSATLTQTPSAASSGHPVSGARGVTISASSRCDLDDSPRRTFKDGNANNGAGETEPVNLARDTRSSKARSGPRADAECKRTSKSRSGPRADAECNRVGNSRAGHRADAECNRVGNSRAESKTRN